MATADKPHSDKKKSNFQSQKGNPFSIRCNSYWCKCADQSRSNIPFVGHLRQSIKVVAVAVVVVAAAAGGG
eukprot:11349215-Ditylum_brightwellii.AAC.1